MMSDTKSHGPAAFAAEDARKPYVQPSILEVSLRPGEAILGLCKSNVAAGALTAPCTLFSGPCNAAAS
jgi:hypothetical protein